MNVRGKKVVVVGLGRTCTALVRLLLREGAEPVVTERNAGPKLDPFVDELKTLGVPYELGGHGTDTFAGASLIIPSPGVSPKVEAIAHAHASGVPLVGEMEFASRFCTSRTFAVTGTNGKTTTTELLRAMLAACGADVALAGNNAVPLSAIVLEERQPDVLVLEVSSYQLETIATFRPAVGAVLNIAPDHLARHGTIQEYVRVKERLFEYQQPNDVAVWNADDPHLSGLEGRIASKPCPFSVTQRLERGVWIDEGVIRCGEADIAHVSDVPLPGRHNLENTLAALAMVHAAGYPRDGVVAGLRTFRGVEHRLERVIEHDGIRYVNDSKATNVDSLRVALESLTTPAVLIAGGEGKGAPYEPLLDLVKHRVKAIVTIGQDAPAIERAFAAATAVERAADMADAVAKARGRAAAGDTVLLSPGCASFDMFDSFEHRGSVFKACVHNELGVDTVPSQRTHSEVAP